jgi:hypothetical protein
MDGRNRTSHFNSREVPQRLHFGDRIASDDAQPDIGNARANLRKHCAGEESRSFDVRHPGHVAQVEYERTT